MLLDIHGAQLHVEETGGPGEPILFLHGFLFDGRQYAAQVAALSGEYRCVTLDFRGQGRSGAARHGFQVEQQAADVVAVIRRLELAPVHLVGLSMGGFVGMRLAARNPELLRSLTLINTSAEPHKPAKVVKQVALAGIARVLGVTLGPLVDGVEEEMYGEAFRTDPATAPLRAQWRERWATVDRVALVRTLLGFMLRPDMRPELADITTPTLVISGAEDRSLPPAQGRAIHAGIPGSHYVEVPGAGHSSPIEAPEAITEALQGFLHGGPTR